MARVKENEVARMVKINDLIDTLSAYLERLESGSEALAIYPD